MTATEKLMCLSIRNPWAHLVMSGMKKVENRSWSSAYRGRLVIHAGTKLDVASWSDILSIPGPRLGLDEELDCIEEGMTLPALSALPRGAILGSVEVYDCVEVGEVTEEQDPEGFASGPFCWLLREPHWLAVPYQAKGRLGLWRCPEGLVMP